MTSEEKYWLATVELPGEEEKVKDDMTEGENSEKMMVKAPRGRRIFLPKNTGERRDVAVAAWTVDRGASSDKQYLAMVSSCRDVESPVKRRRTTKMSDRRLIEFCCSADSVLGDSKYVLTGCEIWRLTIEHGFTTTEDFNYAMGQVNAMEQVKMTTPGQHIHMWASLPCTAGSPWQRTNQRHAGARDKIAANMVIFEKLIENFKILAREAFAHNGDISFEWPMGGSLWSHGAVGRTVVLDEQSLDAQVCCGTLLHQDGTAGEEAVDHSHNFPSHDDPPRALPMPRSRGERRPGAVRGTGDKGDRAVHTLGGGLRPRGHQRRRGV